MRKFNRADQLRGAAGQILGVTSWRTVSAERIAVFAEASDDKQWIHTDPVRAAAGPYGVLVAQDFLTLSLLPSFAAEVFELSDVTRVVTYGIDRVRFVRPVRAGSRVRATVRLGRVSDVEGGLQVHLTQTVGVEEDRRERPACIAETLTRLYW